ncbi:MAG TPA: adenylyl-sulfate kinase [Balneola sp.]|nr:adenylyl-sulfate kinase [Balneola sp.]|tara:strand:+ start:4634 stop:5059 length:426 start_codon:yes stop_codon:yes gene_type:complete
MKVLILGLPGSGKTTLAKPFSELVGGVHINADVVRTSYDDWDFSLSGRIRQSVRMKHLADGVVMAGKIAVCDFICPTEEARRNFNADFTVWMDTIDQSRFEDTNVIFEPPVTVDYHIKKWFDDAHEQLMPVVKRWMDIANV